MTTRLGMIESISIVFYYGYGNTKETVRDYCLLTTSFATSLANAKLMKRLHIELKLFQCESLDPVEVLRRSDGKSLKSILKPVLQFRNLKSVAVDIQKGRLHSFQET